MLTRANPEVAAKLGEKETLTQNCQKWAIRRSHCVFVTGYSGSSKGLNIFGLQVGNSSLVLANRLDVGGGQPGELEIAASCISTSLCFLREYCSKEARATNSLLAGDVWIRRGQKETSSIRCTAVRVRMYRHRLHVV